jgi:thioredoxin reductase
MFGGYVLIGMGIALVLELLVLLRRRSETRALSERLTEISEAKKSGSHAARLQFPHVDLSRCLGCGTCVTACPEEGVLALVHGQATVIHGARCVGHGLCARECPVGAIELTLGDTSQRKDLPALTEQLESKNVPGLFLGGEVTGYALIRTAIAHGTSIADEVARRVSSAPPPRGAGEDLYDLVIVGAGPGGLSCSLQAKARGLRFVTLEREQLGGTVSKYPRRKLVMTQPVSLPLHGELKNTSYSKEELMELWAKLARDHELPVLVGQEFKGLERRQDGTFLVRTLTGAFSARFVCLALGRRGTPLKLGVPGEELPKVAYGLVDAQSYRDRAILVVGGGDSAIEAALALAEQPGNLVTLSYRKAAFFRLKARNESRLRDALAEGSLEVIYESDVKEIRAKDVVLRAPSEELTLLNDDVFILAGGTPPFKLLESAGVSFDPQDRPAPVPLVERGTGLIKALFAALVFVLLAGAWIWLRRGYYFLPDALRPESPLHDLLRPAGPVGLASGVAAALLIFANLGYLLRRFPLWIRISGSLKGWMTSHVATGILALLLVLIHAAVSPRNTLGGHAFAALAVLVLTGAVGRYFYSFVPRAANGRELEMEEIRREIEKESAVWDRFGRAFGDDVRREIHALVDAGKWKSGFFARLLALWSTQRGIKPALARLRSRGEAEGLSPEQVQVLASLARRAHRTALVSAHYEDLRALLGSWRFLHRWIAALMLLLAFLHVLTALRYGRFG